ncbi:MAG: hypothetical protein ACI90A_001753, partial [Shewanella sp.]
MLAKTTSLSKINMGCIPSGYTFLTQKTTQN